MATISTTPLATALMLLVIGIGGPLPSYAARPMRQLRSAVVTDTIVRVASGVDDLSTLVAAVAASPKVLEAASNVNSTLTVLAPTNEVGTTPMRGVLGKVNHTHGQ